MMPEWLQPWLGDIHAVVGPQWAGILSTAAAVVCGGLIGLERQRARKPTGLRTLVLICLGSAIFTQASILIIGDHIGDRARVAAQVVSGIGFLGAGAIIRERGLLVGVTTAAGIWATAAVGVVLGTGHLAAGLFFTLLILATLGAAGAIDRVVLGRCRIERLKLVLGDESGKTLLRIQSILDSFPHDVKSGPATHEDGRVVIRIDCCAAHREHRGFLGGLVELPGVLSAASE